MTLRARLHEQLRRWDDDTFAALANRGLLRRANKDLESGNPVIVAEGDAALDVTFGTHDLHFDERGPAHASCSCPTSGICQHILAVSVWLQRTAAGNQSVASADDSEPTSGVEGEGSEEDLLSPLRSALLRFTPAELAKHAGKPGYRWAWQFVQDLDPEHGLRLAGEKNVIIGFARPRVSFRFPGGDLDALIADAEVGNTAKYRVAAVLAYQRAHGVQISSPETPAASRKQALDFGQDHALPETGATARRESRTRLRTNVRKLLCESVELGLSHLSPAMVERFSTLAVWAQGAEYYRLARLLRRLADHVELLLTRAGGADEHRLLEEASLVHALVSALETADARNSEPRHLVGRARNRYESLGEVELLGMGALPWRAASGYVGLTMLFWSPADQIFLSCTDARPEGQQGGFDPMARYRRPGPWSGLGAPEQCTGRRVRVADAQSSEFGRISATEKTSAKVEVISREDFRSSLKPVSDWSEFAEARAREHRSLLAEPDPLRDWVVLNPASCGPARFDAARQIMSWPLLDGSGAVIESEVAYSPLSHAAVERLNGITAESFESGTMVVARIHDAGSRLIAEPLSLIPADGTIAVDALYFDAAPAQGLLTKALGKWRQLTSATKDQAPIEVQASTLPPALYELRVFLQRQAERGFGPEAVPAIQREFEAHARKLADSGLTGFALNSQVSLADQILRIHYLQMQMARLLGGEVESVEG